jgi:hypothetical protein
MLADLLSEMDRMAECERELRAVVRGRERVLGADHPETLYSRKHLAETLRAQGKLMEAAQLDPDDKR